jgi:hypothetical protein
MPASKKTAKKKAARKTSGKTTISIVVEVKMGVATIKKLTVNGHKAQPMPTVPMIPLMAIEIGAQGGGGGICPIINGHRMC